MKPLVSIVIPNYNNEKYLKQCLDSCLEQTYKNIEIIVVDDNSTDQSLKILEKYSKKYSNVIYLINEKNKGVSFSRNKGIFNSKGEWITTLDSDDFLFNNRKIQDEVEKLKSYNFNKNIISFSDIALVDEEGKFLKKVSNIKKVKEGDLFKCIITRKCFIPRDFIFNKQLYFEVGGYDINLSLYEDWDFKIRLSKRAKFVYTGIIGVAYRQHNKGLSSQNKAMHLKTINYIFEKNTQEDINWNEKNLLKRELLKNIHSNIFVRLKNKLIRFLK